MKIVKKSSKNGFFEIFRRLIFRHLDNQVCGREASSRDEELQGFRSRLDQLEQLVAGHQIERQQRHDGSDREVALVSRMLELETQLSMSVSGVLVQGNDDEAELRILRGEHSGLQQQLDHETADRQRLDAQKTRLEKQLLDLERHQIFQMQEYPKILVIC